MKLIAGLGNPGKKYVNTRHNIGFRVTDKLVYKYNAGFKKKLFKKAKEANLEISGERILILQPTTYVNLSGSCIWHFYKRLKLDLKDLLIICDDINLPIGKIRIRSSGSAGGHNGLASIISWLGTEEFPRLRIGIKTGEPIEEFSEYVLSEFSKSQQQIIEQVIENAILACESWIKDGVEVTMNRYN
ncbi:MAG: aminoacyl-tRNA hydrolase [Candidatus Omnitrophota bacterium]|nr:MAG: aminoacyl-tRNA hydrolase [Candidatus Omnitrophota bacterium]